MNYGWLFGIILFSTAASAQNAVPGEYIVQLKPNVKSILGDTVQKVLSKDLRLVLVKRPSVEVAEHSLQLLQADPSVQFAEPNYIYYLDEEAKALPNDNVFDSQWGLQNTGQQTFGPDGNIVGTAGFDIGAVPAWAIQKDALEILVAVVDTGIDYNNADLMDALNVNPLEKDGQAGVDDDNNGCVDDIYGCDFANYDGDPLDDMGHGTHVAGIIGARGNNTYGISGVAWNSKILPVKAFDSNGRSSMDQLIMAVEYAVHMRAKIINASWSGPDLGEALKQVFLKARDSGVLVVATAGNGGSDVEKQPRFPGCYDYENIITVVSVHPDGAFSRFSNYGGVSADIAAPGANILSYDMNGPTSKSGTSMAAPFVTGVAALLWQQHPTQTYQTIRARTLSGIRPIGYLRSRTSSGGMLNAYYALTNTVGEPDMSDPYNWQSQAQTIATPHPYDPNENQSWTVHVGGAKRLAVHFKAFATEPNSDVVEFLDPFGKSIGKLSGRIGEQYSPIVEGDTVVIRFMSDHAVQADGFEIDHVAYE